MNTHKSSRQWAMLVAFGMLAATLTSAAHAEEKTYDPNSTAPQPGFVSQEFVYEEAPTPQCHASTIAETPAGLVVSWFGGTHEKNDDVGIWVARHVDGKWQPAYEAFNGAESPTKRYPCWNPVLHQVENGPLMLFYKVGPDPRTWWGMLALSEDHGKTWGKPTRLPDDIPGPIKNKPFTLPDGTLLSPTSTEYAGWRVQIDWTKDLGKTWHSSGPLNDGTVIGAIQPSILQYGNRLQILCRSRQKRIVEAWSDDWGKTWSEMVKSELPNPNSGTDAVTMKDGRAILIYNHVPKGRSPLNIAVSADGKNWEAGLVLETQKGEFSYPSIIQTKDGMIHAVYTFKRRRVKHVVIDPNKLELKPIKNGVWPG